MNRIGKLALAVLGLSFVTLFVVSAREPLGAMNSDYAALVNQAEDSIRTIAESGLRVLGRPAARAALEPLTHRPLAPLLSAWSALSVGRLGVLDGSSSVRLPWLTLAGLVPASVFLLMSARWPVSTALSAALWLLFSPGFVAGALSVRPQALAVWSGWLVLVAYACAARARGPRARTLYLGTCAVLAWLAFGLSFAAIWVVPLILVHAWGAHSSAVLHGAARGHLPIPTSALLVLVALPAAVVTFDPLLWHSELPSMIRRVFDEEDVARSAVPRITPFVLPGLLALVGVAALAASGLARRFATGEFRPLRDRSQVGLLLATGLFLAAACAGFGSEVGAAFAAELLRPILACLVAIGAGALGALLFARHARWASAAFLLLTLLVR